MACDICGLAPWEEMAERNGWHVCRECLENLIYDIAGDAGMRGRRTLAIPKLAAAKR